MRSPLAAALLALALGALGLALPGCGKSAAGGIQWGEPANGLQSGIEVRGIVGGEQPRVTLGLYVRNSGRAPARILRPDCAKTYWGTALPLEVTAGGKRCKCQGLAPQGALPPPPVEGFITLAPGEFCSTEVVMNPGDWGLRAPFEAQAAFRFASQTPKYVIQGQTILSGLWTGEARSGPVEIKIEK